MASVIGLLCTLFNGLLEPLFPTTFLLVRFKLAGAPPQKVVAHGSLSKVVPMTEMG
jgi:hypothetical protein